MARTKKTAMHKMYKISQEEEEKIQRDDPSFITKGLVSDTGAAQSYFVLILKHDALKCMIQLNQCTNKDIILYCPQDINVSRKMILLLFDLFYMKVFKMGIQINLQIALEFIKKSNICLDLDLLTHIFDTSIKRNDLEAVTYIADNYPRFNFMFFIDIKRKTHNITPEMFLLLVSRGLINDIPVIPAKFIEENKIDEINILINEYHYILDFSAVGTQSIRTMIKNNSFDITKLAIKCGALDKYFSIILNDCTLFNCEDLLDCILEDAKDRLKPGSANKALVSAARLGRISIFKKLLNSLHIDMNYVKKAKEKAYESGYDEIVEILENDLPEGIPLTTPKGYIEEIDDNDADADAPAKE